MKMARKKTKRMNLNVYLFILIVIIAAGVLALYGGSISPAGKFGEIETQSSGIFGGGGSTLGIECDQLGKEFENDECGPCTTGSCAGVKKLNKYGECTLMVNKMDDKGNPYQEEVTGYCDAVRKCGKKNSLDPESRWDICNEETGAICTGSCGQYCQCIPGKPVSSSPTGMA